MARKALGPLVKARPDGRRSAVHAPQWLVRETANLPRAMLCGRGYLVIENCGCVTEFTPERICLTTKAGPVRIEGASLTISRESEHTAVVCGRIDRFAFADGDA